MGTHTFEVGVEREERGISPGRQRGDEAVDRGHAHTVPPTRVRDPCGRHVIASVGKDDRKPLEKRLESSDLGVRPDSQEEFLQDDARDRDGGIRLDETTE